jgi:hypothetical protein
MNAARPMRIFSGLHPLGVLLALLLAGGLAVPVIGADKSLTAIIVYSGASGAAYVQAYDIALNGKDEVYLCPPGGVAIDTSNYKKQPKVKLAGVDWMERRADGVLMMKVLGATQCFVPTNLKLEKNRKYTPAEAASLAVLQGKLLAKSSNAEAAVPTELKPGTFVLFVAAADTEMAEYARAARYPSIALWKDYVLRYPAAKHTAEAKRALAGLITDDAEKEFAAYKASPAAAPDFTRLKAARDGAEEALRVLPQFAPAGKLAFDVKSQLDALMVLARQELNAYQQALNEHSAGYQHLVAARAHLGNIHLVNPALEGASALESEAERQAQALESATKSAETLVAGKRYDEAYDGISRYRAFRGELPRIAAIIDATFNFHRQRGDEAVAASNWEAAISEFERALALKEDAATKTALASAETQLQAVRTRTAAEKALADSRILSAAKQYFEAYQMLDQLPPEQRALVTDELKTLQKPYTDELLKRADALLRVHIPIRGRADEDAARTAQQYLKQDSDLLGQEMVQVKLDVVNERIASYYVEQAKAQFAKPRGLGSGLGWMLLKEAERFKPDLAGLRDLMTRYAPQYDTRAKLSIAVRVRDHTSRRDSLGYADQVADTIAAGLEGAGLPGVKVIARQDAGADVTADPNAYLPNLILTGDILDHRVDRKVDTQGMASRYRSGRREVRNPTYSVAKVKYDTARQELDHARDFQLARAATLKKKELAESERNIAELAKKADAAKKELDAIPETLLEDIILPYNYTKRTVQLNAVVSVGFQMLDPESADVREEGTIKTEQPATFVVLENVKPEDVDGVIAAGSVPDEIQLLAQAEHKAQLALVDEAVKKMRGVPAKLLEDARARAARNDMEGAAERYILYLNSTAPAATKERGEAIDFLKKQFNIEWAAS